MHQLPPLFTVIYLLFVILLFAQYQNLISKQFLWCKPLCLQKHIITVHEKIKPFSCSECDKSFCVKDTLRTHIEKIHKKMAMPVYQCDLCEKKLTSEPNLKRHTIRFHSDNEKTFKCDICGNSYPYKTDLKRHYNTHLTVVHKK